MAFWCGAEARGLVTCIRSCCGQPLGKGNLGFFPSTKLAFLCTHQCKCTHLCSRSMSPQTRTENYPWELSAMPRFTLSSQLLFSFPWHCIKHDVNPVITSTLWVPHCMVENPFKTDAGICTDDVGIGRWQPLPMSSLGMVLRKENFLELAGPPQLGPCVSAE